MNLQEAIQASKLKNVAKQLTALARKDRTVKPIVDMLSDGKMPTRQQVMKLRRDPQDEVIMAFAEVLGPEETMKIFRIKLDEARAVPKDKETGLQKKYVAGVAPSTAKARRAHFAKTKDMDDDDPRAYEPAPGDKGTETKPSKHTQAVRKMMDESKADSSIQAKAEKSGIPFNTLKTVYKRGVAAWKTGHRPGTTPEQWGHARVNSYINKGKTYHTADKDLRESTMFKVDIDGMPTFYMDAPSSAQVKIALRKLLRKASTIQDVSRVPTSRMKQDYRARLQGKAMEESRDEMNEVLKATDPMQKWIEDFMDSRAPQFAGKSKQERIKMAQGAYYAAQKKEESELLSFKDKVELDEAVQVSNDRYMKAHGSKPRGRGQWMFTTQRTGEPKSGDTFQIPYGDFEASKKQAQKWAMKKGAKTVYVMESADLVEASFDSFKKPGDKFIEGLVKHNKRTGKKSSVTWARRGKTMSSPVVVYIDGKEWKVFPSQTMAKKAVEKEYSNMKEETQMIEQDDFREKVEMAQNQLNFIGYAAEEVLEYIEMGGNIEEWYQNKLSKVHSDMESLHSYVEGEMRRTGMKESFKAKVLGKLRNSKS